MRYDFRFSHYRGNLELCEAELRLDADRDGTAMTLQDRDCPVCGDRFSLSDVADIETAAMNQCVQDIAERAEYERSMRGVNPDFRDL